MQNANIQSSSVDTKTQRIALGVEYDGHAFHGWQRQSNVPSIQEALEQALSQIANHPVVTLAAGRTDAGVHASMQVLHFDTRTTRSDRAWVFGCNAILPSSIRVLWAKAVPLEFDARRSALSRRYRYLVYNHPIRPSLFRTQVGWYYRKLDVQKMHLAAQHWIGEHDFSSFRASECQSKTPMRRVFEISVCETASYWINVEFEANAFLHHMVRNMMGVLWQIGSGRVPVEWAKQVLLACDRKMASITAPPSGLYLIAVRYPEIFRLPSSSDN